MFVLATTSRSASPVTGFMILNRLGLKNLIEPITKDLEFQQQDPFLLYRNGKSIYGVWFYDKDECQRLGSKLNNFVQEVLNEEQAKKQQTPTASSMVGGATVQHTGTVGGTVSVASGVDIMQMLSKAQQEYDTGSKKSEPKPMIDNPNASATKTTNIIRPQPLKMPDTDTNIQEEVPSSVTPGTGNISLDQLFRTASLQQASGGSQKPVTPKPTHSDSYFSAGREQATKRSTSISIPSEQTTHLDAKQTSESEDLPPLLKHIMSTGSMVEDIERQHIQRVGDTVPVDDVKHLSTTRLTPGIPDVTQPPPNHPAYRGPSPQSQVKLARKSPLDPSTQISGDTSRPKSGLKKGPSAVKSEKSLTGSTDPPQIVSGNILTMYGGSSVSSQSNILKLSPPDSGCYSNQGMVTKVDSIKTESIVTSPLLTPADLLQSTSTISTSSAANTSVTSVLQDKPSNANLACAAASLSTELLSPMAFLTSTSRKTPPVLCSMSDKPSSTAIEDTTQQDKESTVLPVAALTKQQLQQSLIYLLKNDSNFITTIHEAYLKSLYELSGQKS
ncbi:mRNA-decapping enzyme 1B [Mactra antiquata]